jgi:hypothetical protein
MRPSTYANPVPPGYVPARGGHFAVNMEMGRNPNHMAFTAFLNESGGLSVEWLSRSVNGRNPNFPGDVVPVDHRETILKAIAEQTGKSAQCR